jgi:hypothetical protein
VNRRLEDTIQALCDKILACNDDGKEFQYLITELRAALREHVKRLRARLDQYPFAKERRSPVDISKLLSSEIIVAPINAARRFQRLN